MTAWAELSSTEQAEVKRLNGKHRDIRQEGAFVLERMAVRKALQERRQRFVDEHGLSCFRCGGSGISGWAKCGGGNKRRAWAICNTCVRGPKAAR